MSPDRPLAASASPDVREWPLVSVVIACRNEARFIRACLESVLAGDYPIDRLEILVVDGMSEDGTRDILQDFTRRHPNVRMIDNPRRTTPVALNLGIAASRGGLILRLDAHARLDTAYIRECVRKLDEYRADNVGGIMETVPQTDSLVGRAIVSCLSHPFGVGNSYFRIHTRDPRWVDTVFGGCYRRDVFERIGLFNEALSRGQDMEFNLRLKKAGGRTLLVPSIVSHYYARSDITSFWRHNWANGVWAILPFAFSRQLPVSWRHLVPMAFVTSLLACAFAGAFVSLAGWIGLGIAGLYVAASAAAAGHIAWRERDVRYAVYMPGIFALLHFVYGLGSLWGAIRLLGLPAFWRRVCSRPGPSDLP